MTDVAQQIKDIVDGEGFGTKVGAIRNPWIEFLKKTPNGEFSRKQLLKMYREERLKDLEEDILKIEKEEKKGAGGTNEFLDMLQNQDMDKTAIRRARKILTQKMQGKSKDPNRVRGGKKNPWIMFVQQYKKDHPDEKVNRFKLKKLSEIYKKTPEFLERQKKKKDL